MLGNDDSPGKMPSRLSFERTRLMQLMHFSDCLNLCSLKLFKPSLNIVSSFSLKDDEFRV